MTKQEFHDFVTNSIILLDGGTGALLHDKGMPLECCSETWTLEHPDIFINIQKEYIEAGSSIILTPTFGTNRDLLKRFHLENDVERLNRELVALSREAARSYALISGDVTMNPGGLSYFDDDDYDDRMLDTYREQISALASSGCDTITIETMMYLKEAKLALQAANEVCSLPVMVTLTFEQNGYTIFGDSPEKVAAELTEAGADAIGANCSTGPAGMLPIIEKMAANTTLPIIAKPNAGTPRPAAYGTVKYDLSSDEYAIQMMSLIEAGANLVGGCCGTTPEYISKLGFLTHNMSFHSK